MSVSVSEAGFWILTSLAQGRRHGYRILSDVSEATDARITLKVTTLYTTLERLTSLGLIAPDGDEVIDGRARRYFVLTDAGLATLQTETAALEARARAARAALAARQSAPRLAFVGATL